mgnify:CR=1 FL=1
MRKLFLILWTLWAGLAFLLVLAIFFPILALGLTFGGKKSLKAMHRLPVWASRTLRPLVGVKIKEYNKSIIDPQKQYIFVSNHTSTLDLFIPALIIDQYAKYLTKSAFLVFPILGYVVKNLYIPVRRSSKEDRAKSMKTMEDVLREGWASLVIYPEGTRSKVTTAENTFHSGAFRLSIRTGVPVAVFTTKGANDLMGHNNIFLRPGTIEIYWEAVLQPKGLTEENAENQATEAKRLILERLAKFPST